MEQPIIDERSGERGSGGSGEGVGTVEGPARSRSRPHLAVRIAEWDESEGALGRHSLLLGALVAMLVALPLGRVVEAGEIFFSAPMVLLLLASIVVNSRQRWGYVVAIVLGVAAIAALIAANITNSFTARIVSDVLGFMLFSLTTGFLLTTLVYAKRVSPDTILGGICVYLLIGLCFAIAFTIASELEPGAIVENGQPLIRSEVGQASFAAKVLYFSFVTMTTLGFGDFTPVGETAQMLAAAEAVTGQLYIAIFVARLVGLYVAQGRVGLLGDPGDAPQASDPDD